jgi:DNA-binding SARP family transcriptional activator
MKPLANVDALLWDLVREGEGYAQGGQPERAETLLRYAWSAANGQDAMLANSAAWHLGWLTAERGALDEAATWFERVDAPPIGGTRFWHLARTHLVQACLSHAPIELPLPPKTPVRGLPLSIRSLGRFAVMRGDVLLAPCKSRKAQTLFRYLLAQPNHAAYKEALIDVLWPESPPDEAVHSLHVTVSILRRYLDPPAGSYILLDAGQYRLAPGAVADDDCVRFEKLCVDGERHRRMGDITQARAVLEEARSYYVGDYVVDDPEMAWAVTCQAHLRAQYLHVLDSLGEVLMAQGDYEAAVGSFEELLTRDEYREDTYRQAMRCYARLGRRADAIRLFKRCSAVLHEDLGIDPLQETQALYRSIAAHGDAP